MNFSIVKSPSVGQVSAKPIYISEKSFATKAVCEDTGKFHEQNCINGEQHTWRSTTLVSNDPHWKFSYHGQALAWTRWDQLCTSGPESEMLSGMCRSSAARQRAVGQSMRQVGNSRGSVDSGIKPPSLHHLAGLDSKSARGLLSHLDDAHSSSRCVKPFRQSA